MNWLPEIYPSKLRMSDVWPVVWVYYFGECVWSLGGGGGGECDKVYDWNCVDGRGFGGEAHCWFWVFYGVRFWLAVSVTKETSSRYACVCVWTRLFLDVNTQLEEKGKEDGQLQISHYMIRNSQQSLTTKIAGKLWNSAFHWSAGPVAFVRNMKHFFSPCCKLHLSTLTSKGPWLSQITKKETKAKKKNIYIYILSFQIFLNLSDLNHWIKKEKKTGINIHINYISFLNQCGSLIFEDQWKSWRTSIE